MPTQLVHADKFFATARERYRIKLKKEAGEPWPWTDDTHFQTWSFTNVHREDDRTTRWLANEIRNPLADRTIGVQPYQELLDKKVKLVESIMIFRWFNRISTGEIIKDLLLGNWDPTEAYGRLSVIDGPIVTGAYIILGVPGQSKWEGILEAIEIARPRLPKMVPTWGSSLQGAWKDLTTIGYIGPFSGYEIVMDLRYTPILENATDVMTWGNLGPGATRGMSWVVHNNPDSFNAGPKTQKIMLALMAELLEMSKQEEFWPQEWPHWEMHEVEMWLCEHAKYMRAYNGYRQKRRYSRTT